ncbi:hypothetical protein AB4172_11660 [Vibrio splendidus]
MNSTANAALSGEQRLPPYLNHCALNTKFKANQKCQVLGIRLKRFVMALRSTTSEPYDAYHIPNPF